MTASEAIEKRLKEIKMSQTDLAARLGTTKQNLWNKIHRDNFSARELVDIGKAIGLSLVMISDDGLHYNIEYDFEVANSKAANRPKANDAK